LSSSNTGSIQNKNSLWLVAMSWASRSMYSINSIFAKLGLIGGSV
jgi:hypothetical protein